MKKFFFCLAATALLSSCTKESHTITNNLPESVLLNGEKPNYDLEYKVVSVGGVNGIKCEVGDKKNCMKVNNGYVYELANPNAKSLMESIENNELKEFFANEVNWKHIFPVLSEDTKVLNMLKSGEITVHKETSIDGNLMLLISDYEQKNVYYALEVVN